MKIELVLFDEKYLELSWHWLNDEENKFLTNASSITKEQQIEWFKNLKNRNDYLIWGISVDEMPIGAAGFKRIENDTAYVFWYIGEKEFWGKRIGEFIAKTISQKAKEIGLNILLGEPIFENFRSLNLLFKEGYKIVDIDKEQGFYLVKKILYD